MVYIAERIAFAFCNVILDLGNISFNKSMQWMNEMHVWNQRHLIPHAKIFGTPKWSSLSLQMFLCLSAVFDILVHIVSGYLSGTEEILVFNVKM